MLADYHMHLENGPLTVEYIAQFVEVAQARGVTEVGISEHCHHFVEYRRIMEHLATGPGTYRELDEFFSQCFHTPIAEYIDVLNQARQAGLPIKIGIEVDYIPGFEREIAEFIAGQEWDYVLGSVHYLGKWAIDFSPDLGWQERDVDQVYEEYFSTLQQAARSGLFDVITHPDLVKIFGHRPGIALDRIYVETAASMAEGGVCCEVSAAGIRKPVGEIYPARELLAECQRRNVPITFSSDAHYPQEAGENLHQAVAFAKSCGYTQAATFTARQMTLYPLD